ncbi:DUF2975 domain-containing protein [Sphingobium tyrosinilyticum]|uniref:DUF2975 domain-containing protein n=1 Tax=Sphingobium tyrosinilyticum TaxID=2715436 RepID=A0ABV9F0C6_9SPHN
MSLHVPARRDPLLAIVQLLLGVSMAAMLFFAVIIALSVPLVLLFREQALEVLVKQGAPSDAIWAVTVVVALAALICLLIYFFLRYLRRIVASVGEGDPFTPANADRLRAMAWLSASVHLLAIPIAVLRHWAVSLSPHFRFDMQTPFSGLFLALILFILARVFREGARMREELDGTV